MRRRVAMSIAMAVVFLSTACGSASPTAPGGTAATTFTGTIAPFGILSHTHTPTRSGTATVTLTWTGAADLDLYVTAATCTGYPPDACQLMARSVGTTGQREEVTVPVTGGQALALWIDNFSPSISAAYAVSLDVR